MLFSIAAGNWASWTSPTSCSSTCGIGNQSQIRTCTNPRPCGGGADCSATDPFDLTGTQYQTITTSCNLVGCSPPPPIGELFFLFLKWMIKKQNFGVFLYFEQAVWYIIVFIFKLKSSVMIEQKALICQGPAI